MSGFDHATHSNFAARDDKWEAEKSLVTCFRTMQGRKQSADGQAQLDVGGEAAKNSHAKRAAKFWT